MPFSDHCTPNCRRAAWTQIVAALLALIAILPAAEGQTVIFSDDLSTGAGWQYSHFGGTGKPTPADTSEADFGFDYSLFGIPEAPNSEPGDASTSGLRLAVNTPGQWPGDQVAAVYEDAAFSGQYTLQVDVWMNWAAPSGVGSTEHVGVMAGFLVDDAQGTFAPGQNGAGVLYDGDGDASCGVVCDYVLVKDGAELDLASGQYTEGDISPTNQSGYDDSDSNANLNLQTLFPSFDIAAATGGLNASGTQPAGSLGFQWVTVTLEVDPSATGNGAGPATGTVRVTLESHQSGNSLVLGTIDNSVVNDPFDSVNEEQRPVNLEGGIGLMMTDFFGGAPANANFAFGLFDNVRVFEGVNSESLESSQVVPEPSAILSLVLGVLLGSQVTRRRRLP